jgi:hypothetical protein
MAHCQLCKKDFTVISNSHLRAQHKLTVKAYTKRFGPSGVGFTCSFNDLSKDDPRYAKWRESLLGRPASWSKGYTKETHPSVAKISKTFKKRRIDNFAAWRKKEKKEGRIPATYPSLKRNKQLAFLVGIVLGDGNVFQYQRTEGLRIVLGTDKPDLWQYTVKVLRDIFSKEPHVYKAKGKECMIINIYQKNISKRLEIPAGNRNKLNIKLPKWILDEDKFLVACIRGLYEAEGSFCVHKPTYTYKMLFSNRNETLLNIVFVALEKFGFHPHRSKDKIQVSRKAEVYQLKNLLSFRVYT